MAVSVLTLEINYGIDVWSPESDGTFLLLPVHSISLPVYMWAVFHSKCRFLSQCFAQQYLSMRRTEGCAGWRLIHGPVIL